METKETLMAQIALVVTEAAVEPFGEDGSISFVVEGQWFSLPYDLCRWLQRDCEQCGMPSPTNLQIIGNALHHCMDFTKVGNFLYVTRG